MNKTTRILIRYVVIVLGLLIAGFILLAALGRDTSSIASWLTLLLTNFITGTFTILKVDKLEARVQAVDEKVNGRMSQLIRAKTVTGTHVPRHLRED